MDWRSDKELFNDIMMNNLPPGQRLYQEDREAALREDREKKRGFLVLNPDLDTHGLDVEGLIIARPGEGHEGEEYRVLLDPAMKGMTDPETGEMRAGFWLKHQPIDLSPLIPQPFEMGEVRMRQQGIPGIAETDYPSWYRPSKDRKEANMRVLQGRHPMGHALGAEGSRCGDCVYLIGREFSKTYWKCEKSKRTGGPATDIRKKWRGCEHFDDDVPTNPMPEVFVDSVRFSPRAILGSPEKAALVADIRDAMHKRCYEAWLKYHQEAEILDRRYSHAPAPRGHNAVVIHGIRKTATRLAEMKQLCADRDILTHGADPAILKQAKQAALMEFTKTLTPCECRGCQEAR